MKPIFQNFGTPTGVASINIFSIDGVMPQNNNGSVLLVKGITVPVNGNADFVTGIIRGAIDNAFQNQEAQHGQAG